MSRSRQNAYTQPRRLLALLAAAAAVLAACGSPGSSPAGGGPGPSGSAGFSPAALGIVVQTFPLRQRGRALALFFGAAGALTVFLVMAAIMAAAALVACTGLHARRQEELGEAGPYRARGRRTNRPGPGRDQR